MVNTSRQGDENLERLSIWLVETCGIPRDCLEVAAFLESAGWTDREVMKQFGFRDCFELGEYLCQRMASTPVGVGQTGETRPEYEPWWREVRYILRGFMFAMPMIVSILSVVFLGYALWAKVDFPVDIATVIALGTIESFLVTGGFTQAVARRGLIYIAQDEYQMARRISYRILMVGWVAVVVFGVLTFALGLFFELMPLRLLLIMIVYYFFLSAIWLSVTVLYMLQEETMFTLAFVLGICFLFLLRSTADWPFIPCQVLALLVTAVSSLFFARLRFLQRGRASEDREDTSLPRASLVVYSVLDYFLYGVLFFAMLNVDRLIAWSAPDMYTPYLIWFRGHYELGLDLALFGIILPMGLLELYINRYGKWLLAYEMSTPASEWSRLATMVRKRYFRERLLTVAWASGSLCTLFLTYLWLQRSGLLPAGLRLSPVTMFVFVWAAIGYVLLCLALLNCLYLFCLSEPRPVNRAIFRALLSDIVIGFLASRTLGYYWAVIGMALGMTVFAVLSTRAVDRVFSAVDFAIYKSV